MRYTTERGMEGDGDEKGAKQHSTSRCPSHSCRNVRIPLESTGIGLESTGIHQNGTGIHRNPLEWDWNPLESTRMGPESTGIHQNETGFHRNRTGICRNGIY